MFSEKVDEQGISEAEEEKLRSNLMGWAEGSGTSKTIYPRHIEKRHISKYYYKRKLMMESIKISSKASSLSITIQKSCYLGMGMNLTIMMNVGLYLRFVQ